MALASGTRLGAYEILAPLGAGGMGEVYRARDTRLDRTVAIKVLPANVASRPELRQRFEREARAVSSLNHPHICVLHDIGQQDGIDFLVMEYLEGETLAGRLARGPLSPDQALRHAIEIAEALGQAHRQGVFHRDLKPGNVMLTKSGAKLLDFGLARMKVGDPDAPTQLTQEGTILGTLQYMAPEQLEGKETDARGDIFAFGAVLYEMVTGHKAFAGQSQASIIAAIVSGQPAPMESAPALEYVVRRCLAKDPDERWQNAQDIAGQLKWIAQGGAVATAAPPRVRSRERLAWGLVTVLLVCAAALGFVHFRQRPPALRAVRFQIDHPRSAPIGSFAVSPDGQRIVITGPAGRSEQRLVVRSLDSLTGQELPGTEGAFFPFWSPDSRTIAFRSEGSLMKVDAGGGPVQPLTPAASTFAGSWSRAGVILFNPGGGQPLYQMPAAGGQARPATTLDPSQARHDFPYFLPDGRHFLYGDGQQAFIGSLDAKEGKRLPIAGFRVVYGAGYLVYDAGALLLAQPFDLERLEVAGEAVPIAEHVAPGGLSVSETGVLAYRAADAFRSELVWLHRSGKRLSTVGEPADYSNPALSPDKNKLAVSIRDPVSRTRDIWIFDLARGTSSRLTFDPADETNPVWSPDGSRIAFHSGRTGVASLYQKVVAGAGSDELLLDLKRRLIMEGWSPDGRFVVYSAPSEKTAGDLWSLPLTGESKPFPVVQDPRGQGEAAFSPNGRWIAYRSTESGRDEVYVRAFPPSGGKWQISTGGGTDPRWRRDGKELFYRARTRMMAVEVRTEGGSFEFGVAKPLFEIRALPVASRSQYDVSADGQRFLVNTPLEENSSRPITVVLNWTAALPRK
jgi:Tol biopolymer transport system component/predicted Ser/Thr protein kinase